MTKSNSFDFDTPRIRAAGADGPPILGRWHMPRRRISGLLERPPLARVLARVNRTAVAGGVRSFFADVRTQIRDRAHPLRIAPASELAARAAGRLLGETGSTLRPVVNATGVLVPGGSGGAPLCDKAIERMAAVARDYVDVDFNATTDDSAVHRLGATELLCEFTGAPAATIVHSTSAAILLAVAALAFRREIIISRGELLELDDGGRVWDLVQSAGARLRDVGTINKSCLEDYQASITAETAAILRVHANNFRVVGATARVSLVELAELARRHTLPLMDCLGPAGGVDLSRYGMPAEPNVAASLEQGADLVIFAGDGRLGGPRCGIIVGGEVLIERLNRHPLFIALQPDKLTLAGLAATLEVLRDERTALRELPLLQLLGTPLENLRQRAERIASQVGRGAIGSAEVCESEAYLTSACLHDERISSWCVALAPRGTTAAQMAVRLAEGLLPVVGRVDGGRLLLNLRSVFPRQDSEIVEAIARMS